MPQLKTPAALEKHFFENPHFGASGLTHGLMFFLFLLVTYLRHPQVVPFQATTVYLPLLLAIILCLTTGMGLLVSALNVFYEDVKYMVGIGLFLLLYLCPVMYLSEFVMYSPTLADKPWAYTLYHLNPMAELCTAFRKVLLAPQNAHVAGREVPPLPLDWPLIGVAAATSLAILVIGYRVFNHYKWRFVERS